MRQTAELENQMTSVERVIEYTDLKSEPALESLEKYRPPEKWPECGIIQFDGLSMRYSENSNTVLKDVTLRIESKEKIGVVGRTGAGNLLISRDRYFGGKISFNLQGKVPSYRHCSAWL